MTREWPRSMRASARQAASDSMPPYARGGTSNQGGIAKAMPRRRPTGAGAAGDGTADSFEVCMAFIGVSSQGGGRVGHRFRFADNFQAGRQAIDLGAPR